MRNEKLILFVLASLQFTHVLDFVIMMPLAPQFMSSFQISPQEFGVMVSIYTIAAGISALFAASFVDRFDRKRVLLFLYGGFTISTFLCAASPNHWYFSIARGFAGTFGGIIHGITQSIIGDIFPENKRGRATGVLSSAFSVASVAGVPFGIFLATKFDWHAPFIALGVVSMAVFFIAMKAIPPIRGHLRHTGHKRPNIINLLTDGKLWPAYALTASLMFAGFTIIPYISAYYVGNLGLAVNELPYVYFFGGMATFFASPYIGRLADIHGKHKVFLVVALLSLIPIFAVTHMPHTPLGALLVVSTVFMVFISGRFVPGMALIVSSVDPRIRGGFMSTASSIQNLAAGLAAQIGGFLVGSEGEGGALAHFNWAGYFAMVMTLAAIWVSRQVKIRD